jgi:EAL domain-containing protein (putative c-di-GMP-specific phosphodiesterase class I)
VSPPLGQRDPLADSPPGGEASRRLLFDNVTDLPLVPLLLGKMKGLLSEAGQLGLITVNIVQERPVEQAFGWRSFDRLLKEVADFLADFKAQHLRREDDVADMMVNGNAFVILLSPPRDRQRMQHADLERTRERIRRPLRSFLASRLPPRFTDCFGCHVGCALVEDDPNQRPERLIYRALDLALNDSVRSKAQDREDRVQLLNQVLQGRHVSPVYQPVIDLVRREVIGYEALSRVPPSLFRNVEQMFQVAQEANATWELERLCRETAIRGVGAFPAGMCLFLNVEPDSIYDPHFRGSGTLDLLARAGLRPDRVVLEMTEHSGVQDFRAFRRTLEHFRAQGFRLAIDDVGSAYSGLQSIAEVRPDFIKIDMSLTRDLHRNDIKRDLIHTINKFSCMSGIALIAEGVETVEELRELQRIGVVLAQGYLFARPTSPLPAARLDPLATTAC